MPPPRRTRLLRRRVLWSLAGVLVAGIAAAVYLGTRPAPPAPVPSAPFPPLAESPFLNTKPGVAYVGDARCAECHAEQCKTYHQHPMGRSLFTAADAPPVEHYEPAANNPFRSGQFYLAVVRKGPRLTHKVWCEDTQGRVVANREADVAFALGSGTQARSYLWQQDGFLFQSPITWYTHAADGKSQWGVSPNYASPSHFHRRVDARCLYCHCQEARPVPDTVNRYGDPPFGQLAIGCERCHGPGALHVADQASKPAGAIDHTIVNPRHLTPALREAICAQCHLQGEAIIVRRGRDQRDYRPGLPLEDYVAVFVRSPSVADPQRIVSHVEQMHESICFQKSGGKFGCTSCHNAHARPAPDQKEVQYRQACLNCHGARAGAVAEARQVKAAECSLPLAERQTPALRDNCVHCHMPRNASSNVMHLAVTDHRVLRKRKAAATAPAPRPGDMPLVAFHRNAPGGDEDAGRDLALGLTHLAVLSQDLGQDDMRDFLTRRALPLLDKAARRAPDDVSALEARAFALRAQGRRAEALEVIENALTLAPEREETLELATRIAEAAEQLDRAAAYGERLVQKYPHFPLHQYRLAVVHASRDAWPQALQAAQAAVDGDPFHPESRALLITALIETGSRDRAEAEFAVLGVINPAYQENIRAWFTRRLGKGP